MTPAEFTDRFDYDPDKDLIGEGGFGEIYKAYDNIRNEYVALKIAKVQPGYEQFSLLAEYERIRHLRHTHIALYLECERVRLPGLGTRDVALMKYYPHGNLSRLLAQQRLTSPQKYKLLSGLLDGLSYLHQQKPLIIHSDLKPSNILIVERNGLYMPLITDFGISRKATETDKSYVTNTVGAGTLAYAAPEQWEGRELRPNADLWSLGMLAAYIWFNGEKLPFRAEGPSMATESGRIEYMKRMMALDLVPEMELLPEPYKTIVRTCLVPDPTRRVKSVEELRSLLDTKDDKGERTLVLPPGTGPSASDTAERTAVMEKKESRPLQEASVPTPDVTKKETEAPYIPEKPVREKRWLGVETTLFALIAGLLMLVWWTSKDASPTDSNAAMVTPEKTAPEANAAAEIELNMVFVPGGSFLMGSNSGGEDERPVHPVELGSFSVSRYEITQRQWTTIMGSNPSHFAGCDDCPVEQVSWEDCQEFLSKLSGLTGKTYRLPSEAEWEYAARGGNKERGHEYAGHNSVEVVAWFEGNSGGKTHPVGQKKPNKLDLYDMSGNVMEWCQDWYDVNYYDHSIATDPPGPSSGVSRVIRGGGWDFDATYCRTSYRNGGSPSGRDGFLGLRPFRTE